MKRFIAQLFFLLFVVTLIGCGEETGSGRKRGKGREAVTKATLPTKGAKIAFIFPAGAGAMRASLAITEKLEGDLNISSLGSVIDVAGGVSSGSLVAAALTFSNPAISSKSLKANLGSLVRKVFSDVNGLVDFLVRNYQFSLDELEALFVELTLDPPDLSTKANAEIGFERILTKASIAKFSIKKKISDKGSVSDFVTAIMPHVTAHMVGQSGARATRLGDTIKAVLGDVPLSDPNCNKLIAYASVNKKPVFFGPQRFAAYVTGPFAVDSTRLHEALVSSSAIPRIIQAPGHLQFNDGSGVVNLRDIVDGFFATEGKFDPSAVYYEMFSKMFAGEELLIVYVGNGATPDSNFRTELRRKYGFKNKISQQPIGGDKKITFVAIDTVIADENGNDLFNLSGFYDNPKLATYMDNAGKKAVLSPAYEWARDAMKAAMK